MDCYHTRILARVPTKTHASWRLETHRSVESKLVTGSAVPRVRWHGDIQLRLAVLVLSRMLAAIWVVFELVALHRRMAWRRRPIVLPSGIHWITVVIIVCELVMLEKMRGEEVAKLRRSSGDNVSRSILLGWG